MNSIINYHVLYYLTLYKRIRQLAIALVLHHMKFKNNVNVS